MSFVSHLVAHSFVPSPRWERARCPSAAGVSAHRPRLRAKPPEFFKDWQIEVARSAHHARLRCFFGASSLSARVRAEIGSQGHTALHQADGIPIEDWPRERRAAQRGRRLPAYFAARKAEAPTARNVWCACSTRFARRFPGSFSTIRTESACPRGGGAYARPEYDRLKALLTNCLRHGVIGQNREGHADFRGHLVGARARRQAARARRGDRLDGAARQRDGRAIPLGAGGTGRPQRELASE
jgi:hypothetical protein